MSELSSAERLTLLVDDATAAAAGGSRTVPERLMQHRDLLLAVRELLERDQRIAIALNQLWATLRLYPGYGTEHADAVRHRWGIKNADAFHIAIERLSALCQPGDTT
ncbi:MAG: hypothetical protein V4641_05705 [Pseudomonadota bacterium]